MGICFLKKMIDMDKKTDIMRSMKEKIKTPVVAIVGMNNGERDAYYFHVKGTEEQIENGDHLDYVYNELFLQGEHVNVVVTEDDPIYSFFSDDVDKHINNNAITELELPEPDDEENEENEESA